MVTKYYWYKVLPVIQLKCWFFIAKSIWIFWNKCVSVKALWKKFSMPSHFSVFKYIRCFQYPAVWLQLLICLLLNLDFFGRYVPLWKHFKKVSKAHFYNCRVFKPVRIVRLFSVRLHLDFFGRNLPLCKRVATSKKFRSLIFLTLGFFSWLDTTFALLSWFLYHLKIKWVFNHIYNCERFPFS